jgi:hypothetical protein
MANASKKLQQSMVNIMIDPDHSYFKDNTNKKNGGK